MKLTGLSVIFFIVNTFVTPTPIELEDSVGSEVGQSLIYGRLEWHDEFIIDGIRNNKTDLFIFFVNKNSVVNATDLRISSPRNESVEAIVLNENLGGERIETIQFLPVKVDETFPNLLFYVAHDCAVENVTKENFVNLRKLLVLFLPGNDIKTLDEDSFDDLTTLQELVLHENKIEILPEKIFQNLRDVKSIGLLRNPITALNDEHFKNNKKLEFVSLSKCRIKFLSPTMFDNIKTLRKLDLTGNVCIDKEYVRYYYASPEYKNFKEYLNEIKNDVTANCLYKFRK